MFGYQGIQVIAIVYVLVVHSSCIGRTFERGGGILCKCVSVGMIILLFTKDNFKQKWKKERTRIT